MKKVDVPQILISFSAIFGMGMLWFDFNKKVFDTVYELMKYTVYDNHAEEEEEEEEEEEKTD